MGQRQAHHYLIHAITVTLSAARPKPVEDLLHEQLSTLR
jgi:hypothetical protein